MALRRAALDALLWGLVLTGLVLPALSAVGSPLFGTVSLVVAAAGLSAGLALAFLAPLGTVRSALLCAVIVWLYAYFYHWELLVRLPVWLLTSVGAAFVACILLRRKVLAILAIALMAGAVGAEIERPPLVTVHDYSDAAPPTQAPTVIHLLMDEFGSPAGLPKELFTNTERNAITKFYVQRNFHVFEGAYSADKRSWRSIPRILNFDPPELEVIVNHKNNPFDANVKSAAAFEELSRKRRLHILANEFIDLTPAVERLSNVGSFTKYRTSRLSFTAAVPHIPYIDRLKIIFSQASVLIKDRGVPLYLHLIRGTEIGRKLERTTDVLRMTHPLTSMTLFSELGDVIRKRAGRGEYYFIHLLLPHFPYVFNPECRVRPTTDWMIHDSRPEVDTLQTRAQRYDLYYEQVLCTNRLIRRFLEAIEQNPRLSDAVVIIHGDHGSRISLREPEMWVGTGYNEQDYRRDWHSTFFAVRIPGKAGSRSSEPVLLHDLYKYLVASDFSELPLTSAGVAAE